MRSDAPGSERRATPGAAASTDTARLTFLCDAVRGIGTTLELKRQAGQLAGLAVPGFADFASVHLCDQVVASEDDLAPQGLEGAVVMHRVAAVHHEEDLDCREELRPGKTFVYTTGTAMGRFLAEIEPALMRRSSWGSCARRPRPASAARADYVLPRRISRGPVSVWTEQCRPWISNVAMAHLTALKCTECG